MIGRRKVLPLAQSLQIANGEPTAVLRIYPLHKTRFRTVKTPLERPQVGRLRRLQTR
jgi:hypothetical protein